MLALVTTTALILVSPPTLKNPPSFIQTSHFLQSLYFASAWSLDNLFLYLASPFTIDRFILAESRLEQGIYVQPKEEGEITAIAVSPSGNVVLGLGRKVIVMEHATGPIKVLKTFESHGTAITALAVSNDGTLIASASSKGVHIHDLLVPAKHTSLHLPKTALISVSAVTFHLHHRTRLLLACGRDVLVYDVAKPSAPLKTVSVGQEVVDIACSPFSKSLVAAASVGSIGLVDLDKDKGLFKTIFSPEPITSITFTPEGAAIYLGMRDGLRILNLRELDKDMKKVSVGEAGQEVLCLAVQKRPKNALAAGKQQSVTNPSATSSPARLRVKVASNMRSPLRPVAAAVPRRNGLSPIKPTIAGTPRKQGAQETDTPARRVSSRNALSPLRNPISPNARGIGTSATGTLRTRVSTSRENIFDDAAGTPARPTARAASFQKAGLLRVCAEPGESISTRLSSLRVKETRAASGSSTRSEITRTSSNLSLGVKNGTSSTRRPSSIVSIASSKTRDTGRPKTPVDEDEHTNMTSPDLPTDPVTPVSNAKRQSAGIVIEAQKPIIRTETGRPRTETTSTGIGVLCTEKSRGSREKGKGKEVTWDADQDHDAEADDCLELHGVEEDEGDAAREARERELSMQVSPRRPTASTWVPPTSAFPLHSGASGAYELFRGMIVDMQAKNHTDMKALHIDMLRMGRGLRQEMGEWGGEVRKLREENERLREENERLRRGY